VTERSLWLLHVPGIPCHPVFGLRRRWLPSVCI